MIYFPKTRVQTTVSRALDLNAGPHAGEGAALVASVAGSVKDSTGTSGEIFVGIALGQRGPLSYMPCYGSVVVKESEDYKVTLPNAPLTSTLVIRNAATGAALVANTDYTLVGKEVTFDDAFADIEVSFGFQFSPTLAQAKQIQGDVNAGGLVSAQHGLTGVLSQGDVYTSNFDSTVDWTTPNAVIRVGANGKFTLGGSGAVVRGYVIDAPSAASQSFLGLCLL